MKEGVKGGDYRIRVFAKDITNPLIPIDYNIATLPAFEVWVYTDRTTIKKFNKGALKAGYAGELIRDNDFNYHINLTGEMNKTMADGQVHMDFYVGTSDAELTIFKNMESVDTDLFLVSKPVGKWQ